jgi:hypothetical protein
VTVKEAQVFLNTEGFDCLQDAYDQLVFDQRQFFIVKTCIPKVYESRIEMLERYIQAAQTLGCESHGSQTIERDFVLGDLSMLSHYLDYSSQMSELKRNLSQAETLSMVRDLARFQLKLFGIYSSAWPKFEEYSDGLLLSSETDPVAFFQELKLLESQGVNTFTQLSLSEHSIGMLVKRESMRLYTLHTSTKHASRT